VWSQRATPNFIRQQIEIERGWKIFRRRRLRVQTPRRTVGLQARRPPGRQNFCALLTRAARSSGGTSKMCVPQLRNDEACVNDRMMYMKDRLVRPSRRPMVRDFPRRIFAKMCCDIGGHVYSSCPDADRAFREGRQPFETAWAAAICSRSCFQYSFDGAATAGNKRCNAQNRWSQR